MTAVNTVANEMLVAQRREGRGSSRSGRRLPDFKNTISLLPFMKSETKNLSVAMIVKI